MAKAITASVWSVIGTGQNGIWTFALSVIRAAPLTTIKMVRRAEGKGRAVILREASAM